MVVPPHSLVAPLWSHGRSMVISSPLMVRFNVFSFMSFFLRERTRHGLVYVCMYHQQSNRLNTYHDTSIALVVILNIA